MVVSKQITRAAVLLLLAGAASAAVAQMTPHDSGHIFTADGLRLYYRIEGTGDPVVVLHGGPGLSMSYLRPDLEPLARTHQAIFYDQRGGGRSTVAVADPARVSLASHLADLETVRRFFKLDRLTLIGHSWGAALAAHYAARYPSRVQRLVLVSPMPPRRLPYMEQFGRNVRSWMDDATRQQMVALAEAREDAADPVAACRAYWTIFIRGYFADPNNPGTVRGDVCDDPADAVKNQNTVYDLTMGPLGDYDWRPLMKSVRVNALVIHGDRDPIPIESAREWAASLPNARLLPVPGSGHFPFVEQADKFFAAVEEFVGGRWPDDAVVPARSPSPSQTGGR
jgi:proline iminopeptidase